METSESNLNGGPAWGSKLTLLVYQSRCVWSEAETVPLALSVALTLTGAA